jgi:hypothetical protein
MSLIPEDAAVGGSYHQQCVQELQRPHPDYTKIQALATSAWWRLGRWPSG